MKHDSVENRVLLPTELTAENGAKDLLLGEFTEWVEINCPDCNGVMDSDDCLSCEGSGIANIPVHVSWHSIKQIYKKIVKHYG